MTIQQIKERYTCLDYLGKPLKKTKNGYLYRVPWRNDEHPSLSVTLNGRGWNDLATGDHGSVIDLVMRCLNTHDVKVACEHIECTNPSFSFSQSIQFDYGQKEKDIAFTRFDTMPITSTGLYAYLHQRCISIDIAKQFLQEAHYSYRNSDDCSYIYALAYKNDKGGYELRNAAKKLSKAPKGITFHLYQENVPLIVFEGVFDMLSFATLCGKVKHNYIVLNSTVNVDAAIEAIRIGRNHYSKIFLALDNDNSGTDATARLLSEFPDAQDIRDRFAPHKDVNDYLINAKTKNT